MRNALWVAAIFSSLTAVPHTAAQETSPPAGSVAPAYQPHIAYLDKSKAIYIAEFETSLGAELPVQPKEAGIDSGSTGSPGLNAADSTSAGDTQRITKLMADSLLHEIKKAGYKPKRLGSGDPRPDQGLLVTGVFTRIGKDGELRRAAFGAGHTSGDLQLYITMSNLLRPAKPLYELRQPGAGSAAALAITLNPDVATLRFAVADNPADQAVKKVAEQIAAEWQRLTLQAESEGLAGSDDPLNKYSKP
jgi:hypothetical protein